MQCLNFEECGLDFGVRVCMQGKISILTWGKVNFSRKINLSGVLGSTNGTTGHKVKAIPNFIAVFQRTDGAAKK